MSTKVDVEKFIKRQVAEWETRQRQWKDESPSGRGLQAGLAYGPYLLLSREMGAGAHEVSRIVSEKLGWQVFDREIVDEIASNTRVHRQLIESLDERDRDVMEEIIRAALNGQDIGSAEYFRQLNQIIHALGHRGYVIIVGRGAKDILPAHSGLSVRLAAPFETRAQRIAAQQGVPVEEGRATVRQVDLAREKFIRHHFKQEASNPLGYDLTINTGSLTVDMVVEIIMCSLEQKLGVHSRCQT